MTETHLDVLALYAALDAKRKTKDLSWRQVAKEAGVSASTLTRMSQEKRPDVDSFGALLEWLGLPAEQFMRSSHPKRKKPPEPMAAISSVLRATKELSPKSAAAMEEIIRAAYERLRE